MRPKITNNYCQWIVYVNRLALHYRGHCMVESFDKTIIIRTVLVCTPIFIMRWVHSRGWGIPTCMIINLCVTLQIFNAKFNRFVFQEILYIWKIWTQPILHKRLKYTELVFLENNFTVNINAIILIKELCALIWLHTVSLNAHIHLACFIYVHKILFGMGAFCLKCASR